MYDLAEQSLPALTFNGTICPGLLAVASVSNAQEFAALDVSMFVV